MNGPETRTSRQRNRLVCALVYDQLCTFEFGISVEIFGLQRPEFGDDWYDFVTVGIEEAPFRATGGLLVEAETDLEVLERADLIIIPGWRGVDDQVPAHLITALKRANASGVRIMSICSGVFVLAAAGLLDGQRATTHWRYTQALADRYPAIQVEPDVIYVDNGLTLTSAGSAAGIDLALHVVRSDFGANIANVVARRLVVPAHRDGNHVQLLRAPVARREDGLFNRTLGLLRKNPRERYELEVLAQMSGMSTRTFLRHFRNATGTTPVAWITKERTRLAKELLETSSLSIDEVAASSGFSSGYAMRHHFRKTLGISPGEYRTRAGRFHSTNEMSLHQR